MRSARCAALRASGLAVVDVRRVAIARSRPEGHERVDGGGSGDCLRPARRRGVLLRSLFRLQVVDPGFKSDNVLVSTFSLGSAPGSHYTDPIRRAQFLDALIDRSDAVPGSTGLGSPAACRSRSAPTPVSKKKASRSATALSRSQRTIA